MIRKSKRLPAKHRASLASRFGQSNSVGLTKSNRKQVEFQSSSEHRIAMLDISAVDMPNATATFSSDDERTLNRARSYWQFGQWERLAALRVSDFGEHPERGKLALLVAAAYQQLGQQHQVAHLVEQAMSWGVDLQQVRRVLIAGLCQTFARIALISGAQSKADVFLTSCVDVAMPGADQDLWLPIQRKIAENHVNRQRRVILRASLEQGSLDESFRTLAEQCLLRADVQGAFDAVEEEYELSADERVLWYLSLSRVFADKRDKLTAEHFANQAGFALPAERADLLGKVVKQFIELDKPDLAMRLTLDRALSQESGSGGLAASDAQVVRESLNRVWSSVKDRVQHGQALLLNYLSKNLNTYRSSFCGRLPVLIEIGTTREEVTGQGSTRQLAEFCKKHNLHFITVDMDPHNSRLAEKMFLKMNCQFEAITNKGEDYLRSYQGPIDFVFLDAYDFDHGKHSELRQSRYEQFLGARIDEQRCHQMHLDCAKSLVEKLEPAGIICFDDTWLDNGEWTAKGTLAMPFLLRSGFEVLQAQNRAALLSRKRM